ncbi:MAG: biotin--[acetyl-CoA-carboxylase] ligase [Treponema sp.]|jgi:BirA family biotin operon repressor/biotin-[acetyl-CoA-carboxylase] ligase|nr:biotin--[acetyl-CoA-carboxylase] ligase [Treponema sp.]
MERLALKNPFGAPVYRMARCSSTMDEARNLAARGAPHGTALTADFQEAGRGRIRGRPWLGRAGENLFATVLLRYPGAIPEALTLKAGLAAAGAIEDFAPALTGSVEVKWPNDIMLCSGPDAGPGRTACKAAGILTESDGETVYIGMGVNLGQTEFPPELRAKAGSIALALQSIAAPAGVPPRPAVPGAEPAPPGPSGPLSPESRFVLLEKILARLFQELEGPEQAETWRSRLEQRLFRRGTQVLFIEGAADSGKEVRGVLSGIGAGGELLIIPQGERCPRSFVTGELDVYGEEKPAG